MLLPLKVICPAYKVRRDGTSLIFIQYCKSEDDKTLLNTEIAIPPRHWHKKLRRINEDLPVEYGGVARLNLEIHRQFRLAEDIIKFAIDNKLSDPVGFVKKTFNPDFVLENLIKAKKDAETEMPKVYLDFFLQIEDYMVSKARKVKPKMMNVYRNLRDTLKAFETYRKKKITFSDIDFNFYEELMDYMFHEHIHRRRKTVIKGFRIASAGKTIKQLLIFLRNRIRKNIIPPINLEDFRIVDEESDAIYLNTAEIARFSEVDLSKQPFLEKYRDLFVVGCLSGLRFSDFSQIRPEDIRNRAVYKKQQKSEHWVVIPLQDRADYILNYKFAKRIPFIHNVDFNRYIKIVGRLAGITESIRFSHKKANRTVETVKPKYEWITSHTCRRSFCTNEFLAGTPVELIMKISGHKSLRDFYKYIRISPEEAAQKIREIWQQRGDIQETNLKAVL